MGKILITTGMSYGRPLEAFGDVTGDVKDFKKNPEEYDLVMFTGGEDISPELYGHTSPFNRCYSNMSRDRFEIDIFDIAKFNGIKMTGICRGLQFLNVMAGGEMMHHLDRHTGRSHGMRTAKGEVISVNSLHHQMAMPPEGAVVIGWSDERLSKKYYGDGDVEVEAPKKEVEAVIFPRFNAAAVQYHPEMMAKTSAGYTWYTELVADLLAAKSMHELATAYSTEKQQWPLTMSAG